MKALLVTYDDRVSDLGMSLFREGCRVDRVNYKRFLKDVKKDKEWDFVIVEEGDSFGDTLKILDFINSFMQHPIFVLREANSKVDSTLYFMNGAVEVVSKKNSIEDIIKKIKNTFGFIESHKSVQIKKERLVIGNKLSAMMQQ